MRTWPLVFLFGALTASVQSFAATDVPITPVAGSSDYRLLQIERTHPGFGGMFLDENGTLNVYLLSLETGAFAPTDLHESQMLTPKEAAAAVNVLQAQYSFSTLARWRDRLLPELPFKGFVFLDIDETRNRLVIGVSDPAAIRLTRNKLVASKIPQQAVIIENAAPVYPYLSLNDKHTYMMGGLQIMPYFNVLPSGLCTLGFNARFDGIEGFVTAAHCTDAPGTNDGTTFLQPDGISPLSSNRIGREFKDPALFAEPYCPDPNNRCRYSDSVFVEYDNSIAGLAGLGRIARLDVEGSRTIDASNSVYIITGENCGEMNQRVEKIGQATGWTAGKVDVTCGVFWDSTEPPIYLMPCQNRAVTIDNKRIVHEGDSGSPVFMINEDRTTVTLSGLLWGGNSDGTHFTYSCIGSVKADVGYELITHEPPDGVPMITKVEFPKAISGNGLPVPGKVRFSDTNAGIDRALFKAAAVMGCDNDGCFAPFDFDPGVGSATNGEFEFHMWCTGSFFWTMHLTLRDVQGQISDPYLFSVKCNPVAAQDAPKPSELSAIKEGGGGD